MRNILLFLFFFSVQLFAQISSITRFPLQDSTTFNRNGIMISANNNETLFIWSEGHVTNISRSTDSGLTWNAKTILWNETGTNFRTVTTNSGRIIIAYLSTQGFKYSWSDDNGNSWSERKSLSISATFNLSVGSNNKIWSVYSPASSKALVFRSSSDNGVTWSGTTELWSDSNINHIAGGLIQINDTTLLTVAHVQFDSSNYSQNILTKLSFDNGNSWNQYSDIYSDNLYIKSIQTIKTDKNIKIIFSRYKNYYESGVLMDLIETVSYIESFDDGISWSASIPFSKTMYNEFLPTTSKIGDKVVTVFASTRFSYPIQLMYGIVGESDDTDAPAIIRNISNKPGLLVEGDTLTIRAVILDETGILKAYVTPTINGIISENVEMFDDGLHDDLEADDNVYGIQLGVFKINDTIEYSVTAIDLTNYVTNSYPNSVVISNPTKMKEYYIDINRFKLPIDNKGVLADVRIGGVYESGKFDNKTVLYSGGFSLTGYVEGDLWADANLTASRVEDFVPGPVGSEIDDTLNMVYILRSEDEPFGISWQSWKTAVELGAKFYDGNNDGIYNPVDLNGNDVWDEDEDRPDLIGDVTTWTVFNDGKPTDQRAFSGMSPKDIEVKQTLFAYSPEQYSELDGVVFIRYIIENKSQEDFDSVYFATMSDADIGTYYNDLSGCDTIINSGYTYDNLIDDDFGNSPTIMSTIIQGAPVYIADETFLDNNNNGIYDDGIDTPIDTAKSKNGKFHSEQKFAGAKNQTMTSFIHYLKSHPTQGDADNAEQLRNYNLGLGQRGDLIAPCAWEIGEVFNMDCSSVNPRYMYSGNPITKNGWVCTLNSDHRMIVNSGPFELNVNEPVEIIVAYVVGRGNTSLESVDVAKDITKDVIGFYNTNFSYVPVGVNRQQMDEFPAEFELLQNYPNPFNPSTTIKYSIPANVRRLTDESLIVSLKVYDILGREVATLVNKQQKAGNYEVQFDASNLASGLYFYRLQSGLFTESRKMLLVK